LAHVDADEIIRNRHLKRKREQKAKIDEDSGRDTEDKPDWKSALREIMTKLSPAAFERLVQRMLRESGFIQVEVTGRSGDGGIDGKGILRLNGLISFHVDFQCKRYIGSVSPSAVRDFRGGMIGHADKGLIVTTGTFTKDAVKEATRPGATAIDLIDGEQFMEKLKDLGLGVNTRKVETEEVAVNSSWFENI